MGANSVTGVGPGESHGLYKPDLHCGGCGCPCKGDGCTPEPEEKKRSCYISHRSGGTLSIKTGGSLRVRGC